MAKKSNTTKSTIKQPKSVKKAPKKTSAKPKTVVTTKKVEVVNVKRTALLAVFAVVMAYAFGSWAIDSGSLWMYIFTYIAVYFAVSYSWKLLNTYLKNR